MRTPELITALSAVTGTTTSAIIPMSDVNKATIAFSESGTVNNRSGVFTVTASIDGTNFYALNTLVSNAANTNSQNLTRVASVTINSASTTLVAIEPLFPLHSIKITVTVSDGAAPTGNFTAKIYKKYEESL